MAIICNIVFSFVLKKFDIILTLKYYEVYQVIAVVDWVTTMMGSVHSCLKSFKLMEMTLRDGKLKTRKKFLIGD